jgi:error-prone DNA polymerase
LRGGSAPEWLAREAAHLGLPAVALCDRNGVYGAVRFHLAAKEAGVRGLIGCEVTMEDETVVPLLVATQAGYRRLGALLTLANLRAPKNEGRVTWRELGENNEGLIALTGDEEGPVRCAWGRGREAAGRAADKLLAAFGPGRLFAEVQRHLVPDEEDANEFVVDWARSRGVPLLATNGVSYATAEDRRVSDIFACLREHVTLDAAGRKLARNRERHLKSAQEMHALFADLPEAVINSVGLAGRIEFTLENLGYRFPDYPVPPGESQDSFLRKMTYDGARQRYGNLADEVRSQLERELALIEKLGFGGYFLIVWDICAYARNRGYLVQGRGSAANSTVCYALGITAVDPIASKLLFERFLSEGRSDWPDIDIDLPSGDAREDIIQEVYRRYGRRGAAMTANVITFRGRSAMRSVGKVLGLPDDVLDRFSTLFHSGDFSQTLELAEQVRLAGIAAGHPRLPALLEMCVRLHGLPHHLGQHSGGMVLCAGSLDHYVPLENARMPGRSVLQWDKSDCEDMHIIKVDLLGLGMMAAIQNTLEICAQRNQPVDLARIPKDDPATFKLLQEADTVGLFQVESRAQMATLPRMKPVTFYDVAIEVAIIRPGPIQGNAVNPYLARRAGKEPVTYPDERAKPYLERTLGVVLFQEQILRLAMELGGFSAAEADELRRAIGFTRSPERLDKMKAKLALALQRNGVTPRAIDSIQQSLASFALYGFPESHAISFALIAYASAWLKVHRTAAFYAGLLNNQPMGFYSCASLVQDARRHDVKTLPVCVKVSDWQCRVEADDSIRLGFLSVHGVRESVIKAMLATRNQLPFVSTQDFQRRTDFTARERRALAKSGALNALAEHRRAALWAIETSHASDELFRLVTAEAVEPVLSPLERMTHLERLQADYETLGLTVGRHPMHTMRAQLPDLRPAGELGRVNHGDRVKIGGAVITRQRPGTAKGFCFITLEDETGHANAIVRPDLFEDRRLVINLEPALLIIGRVQNAEGVIHIMAEQIEPLPAIGMPQHVSHNYH